MKRHIAITLVFMIFAMLFSGCGSTRINYNLYEDAIANFKNQSQMQIKITQDITSIISGGSSTTTSSVSIDAVDLNNAPIYQAKGSIYAIGAYIQYSVYSEKEYCYLSLDQKKTKVECTLGELLQKHAGIRFDVIDIDALLAMSEEDLKETTLQTKIQLEKNYPCKDMKNVYSLFFVGMMNNLVCFHY